MRIGHNTDCYGFAESFRRGLARARLDSVLLVGAGGAGSAIAYAALELGVKQLVIFDEAPERAEALAAKCGIGRVSATRDVVTTMQTADGLIHATPMGMAIAAELLRPDMWVADVVYFPLETELLRVARRRGCPTLDGGGMAVFQAVRALHLFTGLTPDPARMLDHFSRITFPK